MQPRHLAAAALLATLLGGTAAQAQNPLGPIPVGTPFCSNSFVVDSFYNNVTSNGRTSRVDYMMQLRNVTNAPRTIVVYFANPAGQNNANRAAQRLAAYGSVTVRLGQQTLNNPSGTGALSPQADVPGIVRLNCG